MSKFCFAFSTDFADHMMVGKMIDIGPRFNSTVLPTLPMILRLMSWGFYVKDLNSSYFPDHMTYLVYIWYVDRCRPSG